MLKNTVITTVLLVGLFLALEKLGVVTAAGAHPFWATNVAYIGIVIGIICSICASILMNRVSGISAWVLLFLIATSIAIGIITLFYGKAEFAASYAENALAGSVWYIGFMFLIGSVFTTIFVFTRIWSISKFRK